MQSRRKTKVRAEDFFNTLKENNLSCFCGVPDSLLKDFCAYVTDNTSELEHTICANEGNAIALAAGHYLATGNPALVYMQNSGLGNCVNPLLSLTDDEVYNVPLLMLIGWRGEPDTKDEPQHIKQGKLTDKLLETMAIKYEILPEDFNLAKDFLNNAFAYMKETNKPFAFIVRKGTFEKYCLKNKKHNGYTLSREDAIETVIKKLCANDVVVATTGHISREVYETRERLGQPHKQDFLTVGSMGHASSIALAIAIEKPDRDIYCFDGDGAFLMHQGALSVNASKKLHNFKHIVFNNEAHDSVGAQPSANSYANLSQIALNSGYKRVYSVSEKEELDNILPEFISLKETAFLEIKVKCGARADLGRPKERPCENKEIFMQNLNQVDFCYKGAIENLSKILKHNKPHKLLIFTGKKSYESIKNVIEKELNGFEYQYYSDFSTNPKFDEVQKAIETIKGEFDIIVAVGGGSVIDFAKLYKHMTKPSKLIAIPTTCGTGSEATQFAVYYKEGKKCSLDMKSVLPDYAIVDSSFVENSPKYLKACSALDAYCQAIESYWAVDSTAESRRYAKSAIKLCFDNIVEYVNTNSTLSAQNMALASNLAGKAINISRTTAAHALSYSMTSTYQIPHGHAVALSMADLFRVNFNVDFKNCTDKRSADFVKEKMTDILEFLNLRDADDFKNYWLELLEKLDIEYNLSKLGVDKNFVMKSVNIERLKNNPVDINDVLVNFWVL